MSSTLDTLFAQGPAKVRDDVWTALRKAAAERILILDGAMGTQIQGLGLQEEHFRGDRFHDCTCHLQGNNDLLVLTQPKAIEDIHFAYLMAGADIVETNTFSGTTIAQADYEMEAVVYELNREGAAVARRAALRAEAADGRRRFVAGAIGPTNRTASISPDVNNPGYRAVTFDDLRVAYAEQVRGLLDGGSDIILIETIFDTLNAKAAIFAAEEVFAEAGVFLPVMISGPSRTSRAARSRARRRPPSGIRCATPSPSRSGSTARSAPRPCARISPRSRASPIPMSAPIRMRAFPTSSASTTRRRTPWRGRCAALPKRGSLMSLAVAAARRPSTSAPSPMRSRG